MSKVIIIVGPTATGKSDLAVELAKQFNGEVVNGDSIAVYRELNIGSAKISEEEMRGIKHHLVGYKETYEDYDVATFQLDARNAIDEILKEEKVPIVVGGTGLYIKALLYDYDFSQNSNPSIDYSAFSNEQLYEKLKAIDEKSALKIHPNNRKRVIRALEIAQSGQLKSEIEDAQQHKPVYDALLIGLNMEREHLRERIDQRVDKMIEQGLVEEVESLYEKYDANYHCFTAIGYKEFKDYIKGEQSLKETIDLIKTHTKQFAKRQMTWFRNQMEVNWYDVEKKDFKTQIEDDVEKFLNHD